MFLYRLLALNGPVAAKICEVISSHAMYEKYTSHTVSALLEQYGMSWLHIAMNLPVVFSLNNFTSRRMQIGHGRSFGQACCKILPWPQAAEAGPSDA